MQIVRSRLKLRITQIDTSQLISWKLSFSGKPDVSEALNLRGNNWYSGNYTYQLVLTLQTNNRFTL